MWNNFLTQQILKPTPKVHHNKYKHVKHGFVETTH